LLASAFFVGSLSAATVPNGEFDMYKPDTYNTADPVKVTSHTGWASGLGEDITLSGGGTAEFEDGSSGSVVDSAPSWVAVTGAPDVTSNGVDGSTALNTFAAWGHSRAESAESLGTIKSGESYTLSAMVGGPPENGEGDPLAIKGPWDLALMADGEMVTPSSSVDPTPDGSLQEYSRTYNAADLSSYVGDPVKIVIGPTADNEYGNRLITDNVTLSGELGEPIPEPGTASLALFGLGGLACYRRRRA
jgi:hypothetical protein